MKKYKFFVLFFLGLFVLQLSFLPLIAIYGIVPDLLLLATVSFAFLRGSVWGGFIGFSLGLLEDLSVGSFFGLHAFTLTLIGLFLDVSPIVCSRSSFFCRSRHRLRQRLPNI